VGGRKQGELQTNFKNKFLKIKNSISKILNKSKILGINDKFLQNVYLNAGVKRLNVIFFGA
jgi:hypothetical protein